MKSPSVANTTTENLNDETSEASQPPRKVDLTDTLSADEVSVRLGIHRDEVYREAAAGELPSLLVGRRRRFPRAWLQAYLRKLAEEQGLVLNDYDEVA